MALTLALFITFTVISKFVFPVFLEMFSSIGAQLPLTTRVVIGAGKWMTHNYSNILVAILIALGCLKCIPFLAGRWKRPNFLIMKIPFVGQIHQYSVSWKLCLITGSLLKLEVPLADAVATAGKGLRMPWLVKAADRISTRLDMGMSPDEAIREDKDMLDCIRWAIDLADDDDLPDTLIKLGNTYREIQHIMTDRALSVLYILLILLISATIFGFLLLPVYMPIFTMAGVA